MSNDLKRLFLDQLQDAYDSEHRIIEALPSKIEAASSEELRLALENHLKETKRQVERLEEVFQTIDEKPKKNKCEATVGLIKEAKELLNDFGETDAGDAAIICASQKVEHYEIATYGTLCSWAKRLGNDRAHSLLKDTLREEKKADGDLASIAVNDANLAASR